MIELIKSIILDFQESELFVGTPRLTAFKPVSRKASIFMGVRRSGKSTYLFQLMQKLLDEGVLRQNILYLNFFDDRLHNLRQENLGLIPEAYYSMFPGKKNSEMVYCFFDEIQAVPGWEPFIDRLMRTEMCSIYMTGSSAQMLSREIATQMRGRALSWELFPFSFAEFLLWNGIKYAPPLSTKQRLIIQKLFESYWIKGGFPEVAGLDEGLRIKIHQEYLNAILFRDIVERHDISHPRATAELAHRLINDTASLYTINSLTGYLKSLGHKVPKASVADYLEWFQDAYFLFTVKIFDASASRRNANPKKIYCIDHSLVTSVSAGILANQGHLLENLVFLSIRRRSQDIFYYRTKTGKEVDFIYSMPTQKHLLIQVCESIMDPKTRKRELSSINEAMNELGVNQSMIVTRGESETIDTGAGVIRVVPAWQFLLENDLSNER